MNLYITLLLIFGIVDIIILIKKKQKKDMVIYIVLVVIAIGIGALYYKNEFGYSIAGFLLNLLNIKV